MLQSVMEPFPYQFKLVKRQGLWRIIDTEGNIATFFTGMTESPYDKGGDKSRDKVAKMLMRLREDYYAR